MNDRDQKVLESYLSTLDRALTRLSTGDRAEIVTEIKGHVLDALEREPERTVDSVLAALGEPEAVANKYLLERGLSPGRASKTPVVKWLTIGFLGTLAMCIFLLIFVMTFFSPLIDVDERAGHVRILGGLININDKEKSSSLKIGNNRTKLAGEHSMESNGRFRLLFGDGKVEAKNTSKQKIQWNCKTSGQGEAKELAEADRFVLDLSRYAGIDCDVLVPKLAHVEIEGSSGQVEIDEPQVHTAVIMMNGKISFDLEDGRDYEQDFRLARGMTQGFPVSVPGGIKLEVDLSNGLIEAD